MKTKWIFFLFALPLLMACQNEMTENLSGEENPPGIIVGADGTYYSASCLQEKGLSADSGCEIDFNTRPGERGFVGWWYPYYSSYSVYYGSYGYFPYYYPHYYSPKNFCSRWGWSSDCYGFFGYTTDNWKDWDWRNNSTCDKCLWATNPRRCERRWCWVTTQNQSGPTENYSSGSGSTAGTGTPFGSDSNDGNYSY